MHNLNVDWQGKKRAPMYCIKHQLKSFNNFTLIFLIIRILSGTSFSVNKISFHWSLINANCKYNISKVWFYCFFLHKLWTYFNQTNNFKQKKICSQKYLHKCLPHIFQTCLVYAFLHSLIILISFDMFSQSLVSFLKMSIN